MPDNENAAASALLSEIAEEERLLDALYREAARRFGLPDCAMWVLYFLAISEEPVTQQGLCGLMMYPKQTVNSSVAVPTVERADAPSGFWSTTTAGVRLRSSSASGRS